MGNYAFDPNMRAPFLPRISTSRAYTLVLDLDETLVHYDE